MIYAITMYHSLSYNFDDSSGLKYGLASFLEPVAADGSAGARPLSHPCVLKRVFLCEFPSALGQKCKALFLHSKHALEIQ